MYTCLHNIHNPTRSSFTQPKSYTKYVKKKETALTCLTWLGKHRLKLKNSMKSHVCIN